MMEKKIPLSCNLRFNPTNERHVRAARMLAAVGPKFKTAFITLAIEAYMDANPLGINMNSIQEVQKSKGRAPAPKVSISENLIRKDLTRTKHEKNLEEPETEISDTMESGCVFYDIE